MILTLTRTWFTDKSTIGRLYLDGDWQAYTLEDTVRQNGVKVFGQTAIPMGTYDVVIDMSVRFKRLMPHVLKVPGFDGIRIHCGNTDKDTEGCILVGWTKGEDWVGESRKAFDALFPKLQDAIPHEPIYLHIQNDDTGAK